MPDLARWQFVLEFSIWTMVAALLLWGLFADSLRRRFVPARRCPRCWYDMRRSPTLTCSECGHVAADEKSLLRPRRGRWSLACALLLVLPAYATGKIDEVRNFGWPGAVPTTGIILALPWLEPYASQSVRSAGVNAPGPSPDWRSSLVDYLDAQAILDCLSGWQWRLLIWRIAHDDPGRVFAPSEDDDTSRYTYSTLLRYAATNNHLTDSDMDRFDALTQVHVVLPATWPADTPIYAHGVIDHWNGYLGVCESAYHDAASGVKLTDHRDLIHLDRMCGNEPDPFEDGVGMISAGVSEGKTVECAVHVAGVREREGDDLEFDRREIMDVRLTAPVRITGTIDDYRRGVESNAVRDAIRAGFGAETPRIGWETLYFPGQSFADRLPPGTTFAVKFDVMYQDRPIAVGSGWWCHSGVGWLDDYRKKFGFVPHCTQEIALEQIVSGLPSHIDVSELTLRITGDPVVALRNFLGDTYWAGSVEMPLAEARTKWR